MMTWLAVVTVCGFPKPHSQTGAQFGLRETAQRKKKSSWLNKPEDPSSNPSFHVKASQCSTGVCNPRVPMKGQRRATLYKLTATEQILGRGIFFEVQVCRGRRALHHMLTCIRAHTYVPKN